MSQRATERLRGVSRVMWSALLVAAFAVLFLMAGHASAQQQPLTVQVVGLTATDASSAQGVISVLGGNGRPLPDLTAQAFHAWINDVSLPIRAVSRGVDSTQPINVALVVDVSGSTEQGGAFQQAKDAVHQFLSGLSPQDKVAIVTFDDAVGVVLPFTNDRAAAGAAIDGLHATDTTALYQATVYSARLAASSTKGRRAVVLLTDGVDNNSPATRDDAIAAAGALGVPIFTIGLGANIDHEYLTQVAKVSGAQFADTPTAAGVAQLYQSVGEVLRGQYVLALDSSSLNLVDGEVISLRVDALVDGAVGSDSREVCLQPICLSLSNLQENEQLNAARTVEAKIVSAEPIASVAFLVDGKQVATASSPPYQFTLDPASLAKGEHTFAAKATTVAGATQVREVSLRTRPAGGGIGSTMLLLPVAAILITLVAFVALRFLKRRRPRDIDLAPADLEPSPAFPSSEPVGQVKPRKGLWVVDREPSPPSPAPEEAMGRLSATGGTLSGQTFPVGSQPVSIGSGSRCLVRLPDEGLDPHDVKPEQARVWIRDGHLMVHELRRLTELGPAGGRWEILSPGDQFVVGTCTFKFELLDQSGELKPVEQVPEPLKLPQEGPRPLRAMMKPVIPEAPLETLAPGPERQWAVRPESPAVPTEAVAPEQLAETAALEPMPASVSEETAPVAGLAPGPAIGSTEDVDAEPAGEPEAEAEEGWNAPIPFRRPLDPPAAATGAFADTGDSIPDILRDRAQQIEGAASEGDVPNILRDRPSGAQAGPFGDAESTPPPSNAVPNIFRDRSNELRVDAEADAPDAPERASQTSANPDVTDPQSWTPL